MSKKASEEKIYIYLGVIINSKLLNVCDTCRSVFEFLNLSVIYIYIYIYMCVYKVIAIFDENKKTK